MIEPSTVLDSLKDSQHAENVLERSKRPLDRTYSDDSLTNLATPLFAPPLEEERPVKRVKSTKISSVDDAHLSMDLEFVKKICPDTKFFITPAEGGLEHIKEALNLLESLLLSLPNFTLASASSSDLESYFSNLVDSFFAYVASEGSTLNLEDKDLDHLPSGDEKILTKVGFKPEQDRKLVMQLFLAAALSYSWCLKLFQQAESALAMSRSDFTDNGDQILKVALGLKESNRNYVFYTHVAQQLWEVLKSKDEGLNAFIVEFMERIAFLNSIAKSEMSYEPQYWNRLRARMEPSKEASALASKDQHQENLNMIRQEMAKRISARSKCEYLRRELEKANSELAQMESKSEELLSKVELLRKQLTDLPSSVKLDQTTVAKMAESKRLPPKLFNLLSHLYNFTASNSLREVTYKVVKDHEYSFHMSLLAPKDMLFPSLEATKFLFPLVLHFYLQEGELRIKQVNSPRLSISKKAEELVMDRFLGVEQDPQLDLGLQDVEDQLPEEFHDRIEALYKLAQEFVWNLYVLESYKSNNKSILSKILPEELQRRTPHSKYTYKEKVTWTLANDAASVSLHLVVTDGTTQFQFTDFEKKGNLPDLEHSKLVDHVKSKHELKLENLTALSEAIHDHFKTARELIRTAVLFEAYAVLFDFLSL